MRLAFGELTLAARILLGKESTERLAIEIRKPSARCLIRLSILCTPSSAVSAEVVHLVGSP